MRTKFRQSTEMSAARRRFQQLSALSSTATARACLDEKEDPDDVAVKKLDHAFAETRNRDCDAETS